jgi:hypothetical protein
MDGADVRFHSLITVTLLNQLHNESVLTVYAPVMESYRLVPIESMVCGKKVVRISEGGVCETVHHSING